MDASPRIELIVGPMYSGKTSELMRRVRRFTHAKKRCLMIKYKHDTRYSEECVASHDKQLMVALPAAKLADVMHHTPGFDVVAIDEAQFFPDGAYHAKAPSYATYCNDYSALHMSAVRAVVECAEELANSGKIVLMAALDGDFRRKPFGRVLELIPLAERIDKLTAVCTSCYGEAAFTKRTVASTAIELIGGAESYQPVCRHCYSAHTKAEPRTELPSQNSPVSSRADSPAGSDDSDSVTAFNGATTPPLPTKASAVTPESDPSLVASPAFHPAAQAVLGAVAVGARQPLFE